MRIRIIVSIMLITWGLIPGYSQLQEVDFGTSYKAKGHGNLGLISVSIDEDFYYMVDQNSYVIPTKNNYKYSLLKYNYNNELIVKENFNLIYNKKRLTINKVLKTKEKTFAVLHEIRNQNKFKLLIAEFQDGKFQDPIIKYEHKFKKNQRQFYTPDRPKGDVEAEVKLSPDSSKLVFINQNVLYDRKNKKEQITIAVFDNNFNLLWDKTIDFGYNDSDFFVTDVYVDDQGENVLLSSMLKNKGGFSYKMFQVTNSTQKEYPIRLTDNRFPVAIDLVYDEKDVVKITGLYLINKNKNRIGIFNQHVDLIDRKLLLENYYDFNNLNAEKFAKKSRLTKNAFFIEAINKLANGNIQVLATSKEPKYRGDRVFLYGKEIYPNENYDFNALALYTLDKDWKFLNNVVVERKLPAAYDRKGYAICEVKDKTYLFVDSKISKSDIKKYNVQKSINDIITKSIIVDAAGALISDSLLWRAKKTQKAFSDLKVFSNKEEIIIGGKHTDYKLRFSGLEYKCTFGTIKEKE